MLHRCRVPAVRLLHSTSAVYNRANPVVDSIIRVDHAGELGADRIYAGQMAVLGSSKMGPVIQHMWDQEKVHKETFEKLIVKYRVRPTLFVPIWNIAGFMLGAGTALMGEKAAMACTVAVESVIVDHYNDQLRTLMSEPEKNKELLETIQKFRDEEQEHHDSGLDHGAEQAPFYKGLTEVIKLGCKAAIAISKDFSSRRGFNYTSFRCYSTTTSSNQSWDLCVGVCLERKPVILKSFNPLEKKYMDCLRDIEIQDSHKSDHEVRKEEDERRVKSLKSDVKLSAIEMEKLTKESAQEFEDKGAQEAMAFKSAPRKTLADTKMDFKSTQRELENHLLLLVKQKIGQKEIWTLPSDVILDGESLRQAGERVVREFCGESLKVRFLGNAPCGFYKYIYPKKLNLSSKGTKVFFMKAFFISGKISLATKLLDYQWATRPEMSDLLESKYHKSIRKFLISDEDHCYDDLNLLEKYIPERVEKEAARA